MPALIEAIRKRRFAHAAAAAGAIFALWAVSATVQGAERPRVHTNQTYIEELQQISEFNINDPLAVFAFVFASLPDAVKVFPTENYYYFNFTHNGQPFHGNLRLDPLARDAGKIQFGYFQGFSPWKDEGGIEGYVLLDASHGVNVERLERFAYRVSHKDKSVVFALNDLSGVRPPATTLGPDDQFLGPIFDESGVRFFFVFNRRLKAFHFILDETVTVADEFFAARRTDRILIGRRTGFAFYRDRLVNRKILIGAYEANSRVNNWFDGPFDQLPENFIEGEELREAIVAADPSARGLIGRLGHYTDEDARYLINPYMLYKSESDLSRIHACAVAREKRPNYHRCFVIGNDGQVDPPLPPQQPVPAPRKK